MLRLARLVRILAVTVKHGLDELLLNRAAELRLAWLVPAYWRSPPPVPIGRRMVRACEELGPVFVKLGQLLSVRPDLVPEDIAHELSSLQDRVAPVPGAVVHALIEETYRQPVHAVFAAFDIDPLASASIAQVHRARLHDGTEVAVKVVRPEIDETIARDIALLRTLAGLGERWAGTARRLRAVEVVDQYEEVILNELDMVREAASASQLARNFELSPLLRVPRVHWEYTRPRVLVLEYVEGIALDQVEDLRASGVDLRQLAERGVEIFFTQVFVHNFFHADMHPGNIFVDLAEGPDEPRYLAVDFGIMGSLSAADQAYLAQNFLAFFNRDYRRVAELHVASRWVPAGTRVDTFEAAIRSVCEPIFERPLGEISFGYLLVRLFQTARRFEMPVQPQLLLLQKTLLHIEGLGRLLYPGLDLWRTAKPFFERWMEARTSPLAVARALRGQVPRWAALAVELGPLLPDLIERAARRPDAPIPVERAQGTVGGRAWLGAALVVAGAGAVIAGMAASPGWLVIGLGIGLLVADVARARR